MVPIAPMKYISGIFAPTNNRRLNELIGFLLGVSALLLFLALASYSPLDPSLNSASVLTGSREARNWIGIIGALVSDLMLQGFGLGAFLFPVFLGALGARWFRSRRVISPTAKFLGAVWLIVFVPALLALLPGHMRWMRVIPIEGLFGRMVGDALIHYFNLAGAYIVCATILAVALYLSHRVLFLGAAALGIDPLLFRHRPPGSLPGLETRAGQAEDAEGTGKAPCHQAHRDHADGSSAGCGRTGAALLPRFEAGFRPYRN